jgi:hypothetical protein
MFERTRSAAIAAVLTLAVTAAVAAPASAAPVTATFRAQGLAGPVIPTTTVSTDARRITSDDGHSHSLPAPSALTLAADAAEANGLSVNCSWNVPLNDCFVSGFPTAFDPAATDYWRLVVNGHDAMQGAANTPLQSGDRIDMIATDYTLASEPPLLLVTPSATNVPDGNGFTVNVVAADTSDVTPDVPAAGALVTYGGLSGVTGSDGSVTFLGTGVGYATLSATLLGATPSQLVSVCSYAADSSICIPPPPATPAAPVVGPTAAATAPTTPVSAASTASADRIAPSSRFSAPLAFAKVKQVKRLVGVTAPDRSDIASVSYALAMRVGTLCKFRRANGSLAPTTSCSKAIWLPATGRAFWHVTLAKPLAAGRWRAFSRATDGAGNIEAPFESQTSFTVAP